MTSLRDDYARALLRRLEEHTGPVADAVVYLERLDVLAGVDLEQKRLSAPVIEHEGGQVPNVGVETQTANGAWDRPDLPSVDHEDAQQEPVSVSAGQQTNDGASAVSYPAAPSPAPAPPAPSFDRRDPSPGSRSQKERRLCDCGCGNELTVWPYERKAKPDGPFYLDRQHAAVGLRKRNAAARAALPAIGMTSAVPPVYLEPSALNLEPDASDSPEPEVEQDLPPEVNTPARGLAAVIASPPVAAPRPAKYCGRCNGRMTYERTATGDEWTCMACGNVFYGERFSPLSDEPLTNLGEERIRQRGPSHAGSRL